MKQYIICIDAGHSNLETGACANGYIEKNLNLIVSKILKEELIRCGFGVVMTREDDSKEISLQNRGNFAKNNKADAFISIHFNSYDGKAKGTEIIYSFGSNNSKNLANFILNETIKLGTYKRGVWTKESETHKGTNYYGVLRSSFPIPAIICEGLFLNNLEDVKFLKDSNFLRNLAVSYAKGICRYFNITYKDKEVVKYDIAINILKDRGYINSPDYWILNCNTLLSGEFVGKLLMNITKTSNLNSAIKILIDKKIMNSPDYWLQNAKKGKQVKGEYLQKLVLGIVNKLI